jgi:purine-binding chemotaxis protein CheW
MHDGPPREPAGASAHRLIVVRLAGGDYALPADDVDEVLRMVALTPLPESPRWLAGMLNLRGAATPVVDLRLRLDVPAAEWGLTTPILVVRPGWAPVGLIADEVTGMESLPVEPLVPTGPGTETTPLVRALARSGSGRLIPVLDLAAVCAGVEGVVALPA